MSHRFARFFLASALLAAGCAAHHGRGEEELPGPCDPADCYVVTAEGCLDMEDFYMPESCTAGCVDGYEPLGTHRFCEEPSPTCAVHSTQYGYEGATVTSGEAWVREVRWPLDSSRGEVELVLPDDGELRFTAPVEHLGDLVEGETVRIEIESVAAGTVHHLTSPSVHVAALRGWSAPPPGGLDLGGLRVALGGASCRTPSTPAECGMDTSYRLNVSRDSMVPQPLEPGESVTLPTPVPEGSALLVTHGGAVEFGADGCEVFVPWSLSLVVSERTAWLTPG